MIFEMSNCRILGLNKTKILYGITDSKKLNVVNDAHPGGAEKWKTNRQIKIRLKLIYFLLK